MRIWMLGLLAACYQHVAFAPCELTCADQVCPDGLSCVAGLCAPSEMPMACGPVPDDAPIGLDAPDPLLLCPGTYAVIGGGRYRLEMIASDWVDAEQACENQVPAGGPVYTHLAAITSDAEFQLITPSITVKTWVGLLDAGTEGSWVHVTAESTGFPGNDGFPWRTLQPNGLMTENCAHLEKGVDDLVRLHDFVCSGVAGVIARLCECDTHPPMFVQP